MSRFFFVLLSINLFQTLHAEYEVKGLTHIVDFEASMKHHDMNMPLTEGRMVILAKKLYEKYASVLLTPAEKPIIPKIIHQIWLGSPVPNYLKQYMASWQKMHPDWQYILWTDADVEQFDMVNRKIFNAAKNYGQRSDIWRYEILHQYGGLYLDVDFKCLQRFDIFHHCFDFYSSLFDRSSNTIANGLIGSTPGHPLLKKIIDEIHTVSPKEQYQNIIDLTGPGLLTKMFLEHAENCPGKNIIFPSTFFYPSPNTARYLPKVVQDKHIKPESFAIHYWTCTWQKPSAHVKK